MQARIERLDEGVLCTFNNGATMFFDSAADAANFGQGLLSVALFGVSVLTTELAQLLENDEKN